MNKTSFSIISIFLFFFSVWEYLGTINKKFSFFASSPSDIFSLWINELSSTLYLQDLFSTVIVLITGYIISAGLGFIIGIFTFSLSKYEINLNLILLSLASIPIFALAPLLILTFGAGFDVRVVIVVLSSIFLISSGAYESIRRVDTEYGSVARDLKYSKYVTWKKILLPGSIILSIPSLKGAVALSMIGVFVAEWISSTQGLGKYILSAMSLYDSAKLMVGILSFMLISAILMGLITLIESKTSSWRNYR